jgi:hypothetical protein
LRRSARSGGNDVGVRTRSVVAVMIRVTIRGQEIGLVRGDAQEIDRETALDVAHTTGIAGDTAMTVAPRFYMPAKKIWKPLRWRSCSRKGKRLRHLPLCPKLNRKTRSSPRRAKCWLRSRLYHATL